MRKKSLKERIATYTICLNEQCVKREECLRYLLSRHVTKENLSLHVVNPKNYPAEGKTCASFRSARKIRVAWGLSKLYEEMPAKIARSVHAAIEAHFSHGQYYRYRNKTLGLLPADQKYIVNVCRKYGWEQPPVFDEFTEEYDWDI